MTSKTPFIIKCCRCIPLRLCLGLWALFKMAADVLITLHLLFYMALMYPKISEPSMDMVIFHLMGLLVIELMADFMFMMILLVGVCRRNHHSLNSFYYYSFYMIVAEVTVLIGLIIYFTYRSGPPKQFSDVTPHIMFVIAEIIYISIDVSITMTVNSEIIKIRNRHESDFMKMPLEDTLEEKVLSKFEEET